VRTRRVQGPGEEEARCAGQLIVSERVELRALCSTILLGRLSRVRADLVPDEWWERVTPLLPPTPERRRRHPGRLRVPGRTALAGVLYVLRTGVAWHDVPAETVGRSGMTAWRRLQDWTEAGVRPRLHAALLSELRRVDLVDPDDGAGAGSPEDLPGLQPCHASFDGCPNSGQGSVDIQALGTEPLSSCAGG
jgi:transposase